jgi:hypothetical protein
MFTGQSRWKHIIMLVMCAGFLFGITVHRVAAAPPAPEPLQQPEEEVETSSTGFLMSEGYAAESDSNPEDIDANPCRDHVWHSLSKDQILFEGVDFETLAITQTLSITKTVNRDLTYESNTIRNKKDLPSWLVLKVPAKGIAGPITVGIDTTGLVEGWHQATPEIAVFWEDDEESFCGPDTEGDGNWWKIGDFLRFDVELNVGKCSPMIRNVDSSPRENDIGEIYEIIGEVQLPSACDGEREITVTAGEISWGSIEEIADPHGDELKTPLLASDGQSNIVVNLKPGESKPVVFKSSHDFYWLDGYPEYSACYFGGRLQLGKIGLPWSREKIYEKLVMVARAHNPGTVIPWRKYGFSIQAKVTDGALSRTTIDNRDARAPIVRPGLASIFAVNYSVAKSRTAITFSMIEAAGGHIMNAYPGLSMHGALEYKASCSGPAWATVSRMQSSSAPLGNEIPPSILNAPDSAAKEYAIALFSANNLFAQAVELAGQADKAGAGKNDALLDQAAEAQAQYEKAAADLKPLYDAFIAEVDAFELGIDNNSWMSAQSELEANGLPATTKQMMTELGFTAQQIEEITAALLEQVDMVGGDWKADLQLMGDWQENLSTMNAEYIEELKNQETGWWVFLPAVKR